MNKKLVALAVAGALALPLAAEAQTAQVTLYGRANMSLEFVKASGPGAADGSTSTVTRVTSNSSNFGLRGTESLGGGLTAFFQVENTVNWDGNPQAGVSNSNTIGNRDTFLGLQGSYGTIRLGRSLSPYDDVTPIFAANAYNYNTDVMNNSGVWSNNSNGIAGEATAGYDDRYSNSIRWNSPTWSGFTAEVQVATRENTGHSWAFMPGIFYNNGPIQAGLVYARILLDVVAEGRVVGRGDHYADRIVAVLQPPTGLCNPRPGVGRNRRLGVHHQVRLRTGQR